MTQFKDLLSMEANMEKIHELGSQLPGVSQDEYAERDKWRDMLGGRIGREIVLGTNGRH